MRVGRQGSSKKASKTTKGVDIFLYCQEQNEIKSYSVWIKLT